LKVRQIIFGGSGIGASNLNFPSLSLKEVSDILSLTSSYHPSKRKSLMLRGMGIPV